MRLTIWLSGSVAGCAAAGTPGTATAMATIMIKRRVRMAALPSARKLAPTIGSWQELSYLLHDAKESFMLSSSVLERWAMIRRLIALYAAVPVVVAVAAWAPPAYAEPDAGPPSVSPADIRFAHHTLRLGEPRQVGLQPEDVDRMRTDAAAYLQPTPDHPARHHLRPRFGVQALHHDRGDATGRAGPRRSRRSGGPVRAGVRRRRQGKRHGAQPVDPHLGPAGLPAAVEHVSHSRDPTDRGPDHTAGPRRQPGQPVRVLGSGPHRARRPGRAAHRHAAGRGGTRGRDRAARHGGHRLQPPAVAAGPHRGHRVPAVRQPRHGLGGGP